MATAPPRQNQYCKYWNFVRQRWEYVDCYNLGTAGGQYGNISRCCIPIGCCITCEFLNDWLSCLNEVQNTMPPVEADALFTFDGLEAIAYGLQLTGCRYQIVPTGPFVDEIYDIETGRVLRCYSEISLDNINQPLPAPQCMLFRGGSADCPDLALCWYMDYIDLGGGAYKITMDNFKVCIPGAGIYTFEALEDCESCNGLDPEYCTIDCRNPEQSETTIAFGVGATINIDFFLEIPECCTDPGTLTFELTYPYFTLLPLPVIMPGLNTIQVDISAMTPIGYHAASILVRSENCKNADIPVRVTIV